MDTLTLVLLGIIVFFAIVGAFRGLSGELATIFAALISAAFLWAGAPYLRDGVFFLIPDLPQNASVFYIGLVAVLIAFLLFFLVTKILKKIVKWAIPQPFDSLLGALLGAGKAFLIISIIAGVITASKDYINSARQKAEESVLTNAAGRFWSNRFATTPSSVTPLSKTNISEIK